MLLIIGKSKSLTSKKTKILFLVLQVIFNLKRVLKTESDLKYSKELVDTIAPTTDLKIISELKL